MQAEFAQEVLGRLPLAEAVLTLWRWVADPLFLLSLFAHHRGAGYERVISLGGLVQLLAAALLEHRGSGRKSFARAREREHRHEALSSEFYCQMNEVGLGLEALPQPLGGGAPRTERAPGNGGGVYADSVRAASCARLSRAVGGRGRR